MELIEQVREIGAHDAQASEESIATARRALARRSAGGVQRTSHRRGAWIGVAAGTAVAATVAGVLLGGVFGPSTASAAEILNAAAETTLTATRLEPAPGQYIRIQEVSTQRLGWRADASAPEGGVLDSRPQETTVIVEESRSLYVPADRADDWIEDYAEGRTVLEATGPGAEEATAVLSTPDRLGVQVYAGGLYVEPDAAPGTRFHRNALECYYDEMPRDAGQLVAWLDQHADDAPGTCAPPRLGEPIEFALAPAELRAAMFQALAMVEGARVVRVDGDITTIAFPEGGESDWMQTVDVDTAQGLIVGRGNLDDDGWSSRVHVSIIDSLPDSVEARRE